MEENYKTTWSEEERRLCVHVDGTLTQEMWCRIQREHVKKHDPEIVEFAPLHKGGRVALPEDCNGMFALVKYQIVFPKDLDTSQVTDMSYMFYYTKNANPNVAYWDVSNVQDMAYMFCVAANANPDVSRWDVSNVRHMGYMFFHAEKANPDVSCWDVSNVRHVSFMFYDAANANPDMSRWNIHKDCNTASITGNSQQQDPTKPKP